MGRREEVQMVKGVSSSFRIISQLPESGAELASCFSRRCPNDVHQPTVDCEGEPHVVDDTTELGLSLWSGELEELRPGKSWGVY